VGRDYNPLITASDATGHIPLTLAQVGDLFDIDRRIKDGDESGWRGDPTMGIFVNAFTGEFEVWGIDRTGKEYKAASHHTLDHTLIIKLRDTDPRKHDVFQEVLDHNAKVKAEQKRKDDEKLAEVGDKLQWAIRQDFAQHLGGRRTQWSVKDAPSSPVKTKENSLADSL